MVPFSPFLLAVLEHYQVQLLHFRPSSIAQLSIFVYTCEAWLGVKPSVELLRHVYNLRLVAPGQCSGCVSLQEVREVEDRFFPSRSMREDEDFRECWVFMDFY